MSKNKNTEKNLSLNAKVSIITAIVIVWIVCLAVVLSQCEAENREDVSTNTHPDAVTNTEESTYELPEYKTASTGTVATADSKTYAYFHSHYSNDYYRVKEYAISSETDGEYYQTETVAYSTQGYLYRKMTSSSYEESKIFDTGVATLYTPDASYVLYPDMKAYMKGEGNTQGYTNEINFENEEFTTGTINVYGTEYYYEGLIDKDGIDTKYCYDKDGELKYRIVTGAGVSVMERFVEYSADVDYSLFEIPADYMLQE